VLIAAGLFTAGCGSQQGSPLSVGKTKRAFASAGIPVGPYRGLAVEETGKRAWRHPPVALLSPVSNGRSYPSFLIVSVFPTPADGLPEARLKGNPRISIHCHVTRVQNVVIAACQRDGRPPSQRLRAAIRDLRASG
jgi:hypothetical protein